MRRLLFTNVNSVPNARFAVAVRLHPKTRLPEVVIRRPGQARVHRVICNWHRDLVLVRLVLHITSNKKSKQDGWMGRVAFEYLVNGIYAVARVEAIEQSALELSKSGIQGRQAALAVIRERLDCLMGYNDPWLERAAALRTITFDDLGASFSREISVHFLESPHP